MKRKHNSGSQVSEKIESKEQFEVKVINIPAPAPYVPSSKTVYAYSPASGEYMGKTIADESPLEAGVFLLPLNSTEVTPPEYREDEVRVWDGAKWSYKPAEKKQDIGNVEEDKAASAISIRNQLLAASDWTQLEDSPVDKEAWKKYRQELRDITKAENFPNEVVFPSAPKS